MWYNILMLWVPLFLAWSLFCFRMGMRYDKHLIDPKVKFECPECDFMFGSNRSEVAEYLGKDHMKVFHGR